MLRITLTVENVAQFDRTFTRFTEALTDLRQLWPGVITEMRQIVREQYAGQGVGPSGQWPPLSLSYARWKAVKYPGRQTLVRTGALYESLTSNSSHAIIDQQPGTLSFGTSLPYAILHQSLKPRKRLPRRPVFDLSEAQRTRLMKVIQRRLLAATKSGVSLS